MASMRLSAWCALRCADPLFQRFLGVADKDAAADTVRRKCGLQSRAEIYKDPAAAARFNEIIREPFTQFYNCQEQHP